MNINEITHELGFHNSEVLTVIKGGNSNVIKLKLNDGSLFAIKIYTGKANRITRMLNRELSAIEFLKFKNFLNIPEIIYYRKDLGLIVFKWIEGIHPTPDSNCINSIISMCLALNNIGTSGAVFDNAVDSAFSTNEILSQIDNRIIKILGEYPYQCSELFVDIIKNKINQYKKKYNNNQIFSDHIMSVSDLGPHNMLLINDFFYFIDFEFFGKDSINKMVGDFLLHPKNCFNNLEIQKFIKSISSNSMWKIEELQPTLPLLALNWSLIVLGRTLDEYKLNHFCEMGIDCLNGSMSKKYIEYFDFLIMGYEKSLPLSFNDFVGKVR